ncbi:FUSC family protein [Chitinibacter sp. FCG-7]|uniref:FUSC family protein n=1 Tax=Chitinibacter mangrovi TaxID=3153927 RepID=A0AAU7FA20_9NEIS
MPDWRQLIKPARNPFHASRMLLGALAFGLPMGWFVLNGQHSHAAYTGFGVIVTLFMDMGSTRRLRLESMLLGNTLILGAACLSLALNGSWLLWLGGVVLLFSLIGSKLAAGFALDMKLRMLAAAYLVGYPGTMISGDMLPLYLLGAAATMTLSTLFAPRINNPVALPLPPHWRQDWLKLRAGETAGLTFGVFLALACASSFFAAHAFNLYAPNLAAVTTLMVFRPEPNRTESTIWLRLLGVLLASALAWLLVFPNHSNWQLLLLTVVAGSLLPVAFANGLLYVAAQMTFTMYLILALLGVSGQTARHFAEMRIIETLLGALIAASFAMVYDILTTQPQHPH